MSVNSTPSLNRPPTENTATRRGASTLVTGKSPFASVMAQESQDRAAAMMGANMQTPQTGGLPGKGMPGMPQLPGGMGGLGGMGGGMGGLPGGGSAGALAALGQTAGMSAEDMAKSQMARANTLAQVDMDKRRTQALDMLSQSMKSGDSPMDMAHNAVTMRNLRTVVGGFNLRSPVAPMADSIKAQALQSAKGSGRSGRAGGVGQTAGALSGQNGIGKLAAQFESGRDGVAAIGYDRVGGTSYGKYQIASRVGSMDNFLKFLDTAAPDMSKQLRSAGPANTGNRQGAMPDVWRKLASEQPERFEALQEKFIYDSHYKPALDAVTQRTPLEEDKISSAMQEVLWSTAVQHGPSGAARIFSRAAENAGNARDRNYDRKLIDNVYAIRAEQFGSSTEQVQQSVRNRMHKEKALALNMLEHKGKVA